MLIDWTHIGPVAIGVIVVLVVMSVLSLGITADRFWAFRLAARESRRIVRDISRLLTAGQLEQALKLTQAPEARRSHLACALGAGLEEWRNRMLGPEPEDPDLAILATREAVRQAATLQLSDLKRGLAVLATIGSTAPFVGLFGTTFGIIDAFIAIAATGAGGISAVSAGIAEALITTAFGLFVAIPAVWAYNYFGGKIERFSVEVERGGYDLAGYLPKIRARA
jgi:biopolymer transport protein ExbB/TolQ